jgi:hypothetical protein
MELYETELKDARARLAALGRDQESFSFEMEFLPPDPDGGGMFTVQYQVTVENTASGEGARFIGGIGMHWVDYFEAAVKDGAFD